VNDVESTPATESASAWLCTVWKMSMVFTPASTMRPGVTMAPAVPFRQVTPSATIIGTRIPFS